MWIETGRLKSERLIDVGVSDTRPGVSNTGVGASNTHPGVYNTPPSETVSDRMSRQCRT